MGGNYRNQNRNNFRGRGGGRNSGNFNSSRKNFGDRRERDGNKGEWHTNERLSEPEAGIIQFISDTKGFQGIIKSRYSDFHVNELDLEGNEAILSDFTMPEVPEETADPETNHEEELKEFLSNDEQLQAIREMMDARISDSDSVVKIDVTEYDKEKRSKLHKLLKIVFGKEIVNTTVDEDDKKFIHVKRSTKRDQQRAHGWRWPHDFTCFVLHKENIDTLQAIAALSHKLNTKPALFAYAGTKDKRAKTSQWISIRKMEPQKICQAAKKCQGVRVGNFKFLPETLRLGNLKGNRFRIALRSVKGDKEEIEKAVESLRDLGFINYYGLQRFGNCVKIPTYMIGKALLAADFKLACELILKERDGEPHYMQKMRQCYAETKDPNKALQGLHSTNTCVEARLLHGLSKHGATNYLQALLNLPRNMLMLYTHAYQSFMFNRISSKRREMGLEVLEGDLVLADNEATEVVDIIDESTDDVDESEDSNKEEVVEEAETKQYAKARPLTAEEVKSGTFTVYDIVLPLPGFDIKYPLNEIGKAYQELLEKDDLSSEKLNGKHPVFSLTGAYRKVFVKPENFSWKFMNYQGQNTDLLISDLSKMFNDPEPQDDPNGENIALLLDFVLPPSSYATMALREIMKCDTSVGHQINLESEIKKAAAENIENKKGDEVSTEVSEIEKASTEDNGTKATGDKREAPADDCEDETESKKLKVEEKN